MSRNYWFDRFEGGIYINVNEGKLGHKKTSNKRGFFIIKFNQDSNSYLD